MQITGFSAIRMVQLRPGPIQSAATGGASNAFVQGLFNAATGDNLVDTGSEGTTHAFRVTDAQGAVMNPIADHQEADLASTLILNQAAVGPNGTMSLGQVQSMFRSMGANGDPLPSQWIANAEAWLKQQGDGASVDRGARLNVVV